MSDTNDRLSAIEDRLARIERTLNLTRAGSETAPTPAAAKAQPAMVERVGLLGAGTMGGGLA